MREVLDKALNIYAELIQSPYNFIEKSDSNRALFVDILDDEVLSVLDGICESFKVKIFKYQNRIYLVPLDGSILAIEESKIAKYFHANSDTNKRESDERLYLFYYITLIYLNEIYGGTPFRKINDYITLADMLDAVDKSVERALTYEKEDDEEAQFNITTVAKKWDSFILQIDEKSSSKINRMYTKKGFLEKSLNFLKSEGLVEIRTTDNIRIYPTNRLSDIVAMGGLNMDRINDLKIKVQNDSFTQDSIV